MSDSADFSPTPSPHPSGVPSSSGSSGGGIRWEPPTAEELQRLMPGYTIEKVLGRGGMGAVYRGVQTNLDRPVAIKILPPGVENEDPSFAERFKSEAKLMAKLNHPAVVAVYDFGTTQAGQLYFAMEYVDGSDVAQMIIAQGKLPPEHALAITAHVCDALQAAHELGIVHRDIKPANVLLNMKGQVKVADFGLAKVEDPNQHGLTKAGFAMGTPDYVSPEALMLGTAIDGRADLYAVGVMLYQMLTGNVPRGAFKPASALVEGLDPRFDAIIMKAMQHDRAERHQSAAELRQELDVILTVPLVRNDLPSNAAIPVSQVAKAAGQRSAMQKPTGKPPQPRSASVPSRSAPVSAPPAEKSKSGLVIALAAVAICGAGAYFMLGGSKPTEASNSSAPSATASSAPAGAASAGNTDQSRPAASAPNQTTPQGGQAKGPRRWQMTEFAKLDPTTQSKYQVENGLLHLTNSASWSPEGAEAKWRNGSIRCALRWDGKKHSNIQLTVRGGEGKGHYSARPSEREMELLFGKPGQQEQVLGRFPIDPPLKPNQTINLTIGVVGRKFILWANNRHVGVMEHHSPAQSGVPYISAGDAYFENAEFVNLDGMPEEQALSFLSVDKQGQDMMRPRSKVARNADSPDKSKPAKTTEEDNKAFPAGKWVQAMEPGSPLPEGAKWETKWMTTDSASLPLVLRHPKGGFTNAAIRVTVKREHSGGRGILAIRHRDDGSKDGFRAVLVPQALANSVELGIQTSTDGKLSLQALGKGQVEVGEGQARTLELCAVGSRLFLRVNGRTVARAQDDKPQAGQIVLSQFKGRLRDAEIMNLDGLPEAEALKLLGMDEDGKDLPTVAAKSEEMPKAEAPPTSPAAPPAASSKEEAMAAIPELKALHDQFLKLQAERVTAPFDADVTKLNASYLNGIDRKIAEMKQKGDLDSVLALETEKSHVTGKQTPPADDDKTLPAVKELRQIYWGAHGKLVLQREANLKLLTDPLDSRLKLVESALTQQNRIEQAKTVREYREALGKVQTPAPALTAATTDKPEPNAPSAGGSTMPKDGVSNTASLKSLPPGDDRKAAEWVLDMGGSVEVLEVRDRKRIYGKGDLPKRSFDLTSLTLEKGPKTKPYADFTNLSVLAGLRKVREIRISGYPVQDDDVEYLATLPALEDLQITESWTFTGRKLSRIKVLEKLEHLNLRSCKISAEGIAQIAQLNQLKGLNFNGCKLKDSEILPLRGLSNLDHLNLTTTDISLAGWKELKGLTLTSIGFSNPPGQLEQWCTELAAIFPDIHHHYIWHGQGFPAGEIAAYKAFPHLEELVVVSVGLSDESIAELVDFPKLNRLVLDGGGDKGMTKKVTDEGIAKLAKLRSLKTLRLESLGEVSGEGVIALRQLDNLELPLGRNPKFQEAVFKNARPDVKLSR